ncbi:carbohydrate-binding protein [Nitrospira sp. Nam80]
MQKRLMSHAEEGLSSDSEWLDLERLADVEVTSEDTAHPIESALLSRDSLGWRAAEAGKQTIRLRFNQPSQLRRIWLKFVETQIPRTQEYVLRCSSDNGQCFSEIVRQQWNFCAPSTTTEIESHHVDLRAVIMLELTILPDISGGTAFASLAQMRLA